MGKTTDRHGPKKDFDFMGKKWKKKRLKIRWVRLSQIPGEKIMGKIISD
jgi:hypothetical protein